MNTVAAYTRVSAARQFPQTQQQVRGIAGFVKSILGIGPDASPLDPTPENRFHNWDTSPSPQLRTRAATIRAHAKCPVTHKEINFTCPYSGIPTHHSQEAWEQDTEYHKTKKYEILRKVNIYEHDLRSGRSFPEFDFPYQQDPNKLVSFDNWDLFFYTREFVSMDTEFQFAATTKMLSYPLTVGSVLHKLSPYAMEPKGPVTLEGLKSLAALRYSLYPFERNATIVRDRPMRFFIVGARAESQLPLHVWKQLNYVMDQVDVDLHFIGPECLYSAEKQKFEVSETPVVNKIDDELGIFYHTDYFHVYHEAQDFFPYDPYSDCFFVFHPGFGATEANDKSWSKTVEGLLETKCPVFVTSYNEQDSLADYNWVMDQFGDKLDIMMHRTNNIFGSTKWELNDMDPQEVYQFNQKLFGFRGKRYHAVNV